MLWAGLGGMLDTGFPCVATRIHPASPVEPITHQLTLAPTVLLCVAAAPLKCQQHAMPHYCELR